MKRIALLLFCITVFVSSRAANYKQYYDDLPTPIKAVEPFAVPERTVSLPAFGGVADGVTLNTEAFSKAIAVLSKQGGGRLVVPEGVWLTGPIVLKDNIELHLNRGAIIYFTPDKRLYLTPEGRSKRANPCISASKCRNIAITGEGVIDGNGQQWRPVKRGKMSDVEWNLYLDMGGQVTEKGDLWYPWQMKNGYPDIATDAKTQESMRNDLFRIEQCENVLLQGVTFQNAPRFHVHPCYSRNIIIDGITVRCPWNVQNGDGIDLSDCHQALIVRSTVDVGDDGICMKSGSQKKGWDVWGCQDIVIMDNTVFHAHGGFVLGSETIGGVRDMVVKRNSFLGTDVGLRFKSGLGRGGRTERMFISNIMMADIKDEAISFQCDYVNRQAGDDGTSHLAPRTSHLAPRTPVPPYPRTSYLVPQFQDIHIQNVVCRGCYTGIKAGGIAELDCVKDIDISDCYIVYNTTAKNIDENTAKLRLTRVTLTPSKAQ